MKLSLNFVFSIQISLILQASCGQELCQYSLFSLAVNNMQKVYLYTAYCSFHIQQDLGMPAQSQPAAPSSVKSDGSLLLPIAESLTRICAWWSSQLVPDHRLQVTLGSIQYRDNKWTQLVNYTVRRCVWGSLPGISREIQAVYYTQRHSLTHT